uniref:Uncharacterized protein n=1 Tax=Romanomermis culicivorax TaxID=13658 RepID=A0A915K4W4_ROMCU
MHIRMRIPPITNLGVNNDHFCKSTFNKKMIKCRFLLSTRFERTLFTKSCLSNLLKRPVAVKFSLIRNRDARNVTPYKRCSWTQAVVDISSAKVKPYLKLIRIDKPIVTQNHAFMNGLNDYYKLSNLCMLMHNRPHY